MTAHDRRITRGTCRPPGLAGRRVDGGERRGGSRVRGSHPGCSLDRVRCARLMLLALAVGCAQQTLALPVSGVLSPVSAAGDGPERDRDYLAGTATTPTTTTTTTTTEVPTTTTTWRGDTATHVQPARVTAACCRRCRLPVTGRNATATTWQAPPPHRPRPQPKCRQPRRLGGGTPRPTSNPPG
jgi:hypothetical protein